MRDSAAPADNIPDASEFERKPVPEDKTKRLGGFVGLFASEHVAATELLIGPLFLASGVSAVDVLVGLFIGNALAVLSWTLLTAPIAVKYRLTLYYQLELIGGQRIIDFYNLVNGILWCCLGGAFIYVSATALFVPLHLTPPQLSDWAPTSIGMVVVVIATGAVMTIVAAKGYDTIARFANIAAPWMVVMFIIFGIAALPELGVRSVADLWKTANQVWDGAPSPGHTKFTFWHVVCFAWFGNMAWHFGMGDLSIFRYARKASYGLATAAGMYLGHYLAWITAGLLYAVQLKLDPTDTSVVPGPMAFRVAGAAGIFLVLIAGWTTANPAIYRAGLAFHSIRPKWHRSKVTSCAGIFACAIATFPGLCNKFLSVAMLYGLMLMPMGAVVFADNYLMRPFGMQSFFASRQNIKIYWPPMIAWIISLAACLALWRIAGVEEFFLCLPGWLLAVIIYVISSKVMQR